MKNVAARLTLSVALAGLAGLGGCADDPPDAAAGDAADFAAGTGGKADGGRELPRGETFELQIAHGAYPVVGTRPNVLVYVPHGFDATGPLNVVVFLHGWWNCVRNVVGPVNTACSTGGPRRQAYDVAGQLEASHKNAILVVPELRFEQPSGDAGALAGADAFAALIDDTLVAMQPRLGDRRGDLGAIVIASHSGGYQATAAIATRGGLPVDEIYLLDSLYGQQPDFEAWMADPGHRAELVTQPFTMRLASVYSGTGGTLANNQTLATRAASWAGDALRDDRTAASPTIADLGHGLYVKRSGLGHDDIPRYYVERLLTTSALPDKPAVAPPE